MQTGGEMNRYGNGRNRWEPNGIEVDLRGRDRGEMEKICRAPKWKGMNGDEMERIRWNLPRVGTVERVEDMEQN